MVKAFTPCCTSNSLSLRKTLSFRRLKHMLTWPVGAQSRYHSQGGFFCRRNRQIPLPDCLWLSRCLSYQQSTWPRTGTIKTAYCSRCSIFHSVADLEFPSTQQRNQGDSFFPFEELNGFRYRQWLRNFHWLNQWLLARLFERFHKIR